MPKRDKPTKDRDGSNDAGTVTIEADSVEEAMQRLATEVGETAEIVDARKVHRGGIGGFFAKERVQLTARSSSEPEPAVPSQPELEGLSGVLDRMTRSAEAQETQFATMLRQELGSSSRDLGLDTFLEAVGWDDRTSTDAAEKTHSAIGELTAAMTAPPAPEPPPAQQSASTPHLSDDQPTEAAPHETLPVADIEMPPPQPIVVQRVSLAPDVTPRTPTADNPATFAPLQPRVGLVASFPGPSLMQPFPAAQEVAADAVAEIPSWRVTNSTTDPAGMGPVAWTTMDLVRHGIPKEIVSAVADIDPNDDIAWITGLAAAVAPYCGPLPEGDTVIVGPNAEDIADVLGIDMVEPGQTAPYDGSFATEITSDPHHRDWLEFVRGRRSLQYAIGTGQVWRQIVLDAPAVISWVGETTLVDALYLAVAFDATLGYGVLPASAGTVTRIYPVDVALAIRSMMGRS